MSGSAGESSGSSSGSGRIAVLPAALADQIAAGEVVERPASIVKELVDNAVDAGATRIEIVLEAGGVERIAVIDDGRGIHREDLELAVTRHATSKLRTPDELVEIRTLGFRGEALASIAAVARVEIRSRRAGEALGHRLASVPGAPLGIEPVGMPQGTQVAVVQLFANVPARRKFLRSEATEVGHCVEAVIRIALVHPQVHFTLRHNGRKNLELPASDQGGRVEAILRRRGGAGPFTHFAGEREGVAVEGWFAPPTKLARNASLVVVRRRVVRERTLAAVIKQAYGEELPRRQHPCACLFVEPPHGTVDVNVHPQKTEVRFSSAQTVYAAVREVVAEGLAGAGWGQAEPVPGGEDPGGEDPGGQAGAAGEHGWSRPQGEGARAALAGWTRREGLGSMARDADPRGSGGGSKPGYRLGTRAATGEARRDSIAFRSEVEQLRTSLAEVRRQSNRTWTAVEPERPPEPAAPEPERGPRPQLLTCLPGPVAVFEFDGALLVADLRRVRAALVRRRLLAELAATGPEGRAPAQGLLTPVVVRRDPGERGRLLASREALASLGLELEGFGDDAVLVRAVPAVLPELLDSAAVGALLDRLMPWLELHAQRLDPRGDDTRAGFATLVAEHAGDEPVDTSPRLARRWIAELVEGHEAAGLDALPGLRRWSARALVHTRPEVDAEVDAEVKGGN